MYLQCRIPGFDPWVGKIHWRRERLPTPVFWPGIFHSPWACKELDTSEQLSFQSFPCSLVGKASACNVGDLSSVPGSGSSPGEGNGNPLQYSCLENSMDRGAWQAIVGHDYLPFFLACKNCSINVNSLF